MAFNGKLATQEIDQNPVEVVADEKDSWVQDLLVRAAPQSLDLLEIEGPEAWAKGSQLKIDVKADKIGTDYGLRGTLRGQVPSLCSRCGETFLAPRQASFQLYLHRNTGNEDHPDGSAEDPDYIFFHGDQLNLIELLAEQLIVLEPIAEWPSKDNASRKCNCWEKPAVDLQGSGQESEKKAFSPFAKLQDLFKKED